MGDSTLFKPKNYPVRSPTDAKLVHGSTQNPPRYPQIGGMDAAHKAKGVQKNRQKLRKPGDTK